MDIRSEFYKHIVLSGGSTMYPGLPSRLEKEIKQLYLTRTLNGDISRLEVRACGRLAAPASSPADRAALGPGLASVLALVLTQKFKVRIEDPPRRKHMVFLGGAVLADIMKDKDDFWLTKTDFEEQGVTRLLSRLGISA